MELIQRGWTNQALTQQQDLNEFIDFLLSQSRPTFVCGDWSPLPLLTGDMMSDTHLNAEKGLAHSAIRLQLPLDHHAQLSLHDLLCIWRDSQGLCRLLHQASEGLSIAIDRSCNETRLKLTAPVMIPDELFRIEARHPVDAVLRS